MNIPKLKQTFKVEYKYFQDDKVIVCYVTPEKYTPGFCEITEKRFKGVAFFKDGDIFNKNIGEEISKKKAIRNYFKWLKQEYSFYWRKYLLTSERWLEFIKQADKRIDDFTNEIIEMTKEN